MCIDIRANFCTYVSYFSYSAKVIYAFCLSLTLTLFVIIKIPICPSLVASTTAVPKQFYI